MIIEVAEFTTDQGDDFEAAMDELREVIGSSPGYLGHTVQRGIENPNRYLLLVRWESVEAHETGFRQSEAFTTWRTRLGPHRDGVHAEHFTTVLEHRWSIEP